MASESLDRSAADTGAHTTGTGAKGGGNSTHSTNTKTTGSICAFWIGERCFGLDTGLVGEVVSVEERVPVPLAPTAVRGVFSLRGEPLPLISLADILGLGRPSPSAPKTITAMVLRSGDLSAGLSIDRIQAILAVDRSTLTPPTNAQEDSAVLGFFEIASENRPVVVSVLDPGAVLERLMQLRFVRDPGG